MAAQLEEVKVDNVEHTDPPDNIVSSPLIRSSTPDPLSTEALKLVQENDSLKTKNQTKQEIVSQWKGLICLTFFLLKISYTVSIALFHIFYHRSIYWMRTSADLLIVSAHSPTSKFST